jgi:hypothetical protein
MSAAFTPSFKFYPKLLLILPNSILALGTYSHRELTCIANPCCTSLLLAICLVHFNKQGIPSLMFFFQRHIIVYLSQVLITTLKKVANRP